jgi:lysozyme family protein
MSCGPDHARAGQLWGSTRHYLKGHTKMDEKQTQLAVAALRIAQTHLLEALEKRLDDADLDGTWTWIEKALRALGCDD